MDRSVQVQVSELVFTHVEVDTVDTGMVREVPVRGRLHLGPRRDLVHDGLQISTQARGDLERPLGVARKRGVGLFDHRASPGGSVVEAQSGRAQVALVRSRLEAWTVAEIGRSPAEADALAAEARAAGVHHAISLQGAASPAALRAAELIRAGRLGRLRSARAVSTTAGYAARLPSTYAYLNDPVNGANLSTILGGHTLDLMELLLGPVTSVDALGRVQHPEIMLTDTGGVIARTTPDHLFVLSRHAGGCVASVEIGGDRPPDTPFVLELIGDAGALKLLGGHPHGFQAGELRLEVDGRPEPIAVPVATGGLKGAAANIGEVYARLAADIRDDAHTAPDFVHAARLTRLIATVTRAAQTGVRETVELR